MMFLLLVSVLFFSIEAAHGLDDTADLVLVNESAGRCLDGSFPAFYIRVGDPKKVVIGIEGDSINKSRQVFGTRSLVFQYVQHSVL